MFLEHKVLFNAAQWIKRPDGILLSACLMLRITNGVTTGKNFKPIIDKINKTSDIKLTNREAEILFFKELLVGIRSVFALTTNNLNDSNCNIPH